MMEFDDYESLPSNSVANHMLAGAAAGIMEHCILYPLDSVKLTENQTEYKISIPDYYVAVHFYTMQWKHSFD